MSGSNSVVESRLPKPLVAGSIPVSRSIFSNHLVRVVIPSAARDPYFHKDC